MLLGIFAKTFAAKGARASLAAVRAAGFEAAQFNMACLGLPSMPEAIPAAIADEIAAAARETGVALPALSGTYNMIHPDPRRRAEGLARLAVLLTTARRIGIGVLTVCTGTRDAEDMWRAHPANASREAWADLCEEMAKALRLAEEAGVDIGVEPELANVIDSVDKALRLASEMRSPRLRFVLDPANLIEIATPAERRAIIEDAALRLAGGISIAHAKDRAADGLFVAAGKGVIDFKHFIRSLRRAGFDGPLIAHGLDEREAPDVARYLRAAMEDK